MAQIELRHTFGMELSELPMRDKTRLAQRRAAASQGGGGGGGGRGRGGRGGGRGRGGSGGGLGGGPGGSGDLGGDRAASSSRSYILTSTLAAEYRSAETVVPHGSREQAYLGLVSFVTALIYLNGRVLAANKLHRYLRRLNADDFTPIDRTEKVLQTMQRHGYLVRVKDTSGEETSYDYHLGPRAKVEIGEAGVKAMIAAVYGDAVPEDLDQRFRRNLGAEIRASYADFGGDGDDNDGDGKNRKHAPAPARRPSRRADEEQQGQEEEEEEEDGDDE